MPGRLTQLDEWPRHQAGGTFDTVVDGSPHWSDGHYFTTGADDGSLACFVGLRLHPNNDVLDGFACVSSGTRQRNARWSRRLRPRIDDFACGPLSAEFVEPLKVIRFVCAPNARGVAFDLTFEGVAEPYNEERVITVLNGRIHSDRSNYDQCGVVHGWIDAGEGRVEVDGWTGVRDHSWGIGNNTGGPRSAAIAPLPEPTEPVGLRQWCIFRLPDRVVFWQFHRSAAGALTKFEGQCSYLYGDPRPAYAYRSVTHEVTWEAEDDGRLLRRLRQATIHLERADGTVEHYRVEPISPPVYMQGGGYWAGFDDGRGRGVYRGDECEEGEDWGIAHPTRITGSTGAGTLRADSWAEAWGRCWSLDDGTSGTGHLECVVVGPYPGFDDGAP